LADVRWHIALLGCDAEFGSLRDIADIDQAAPIKLVYEDTPEFERTSSISQQRTCRPIAGNRLVSMPGTLVMVEFQTVS
jgi:hypothetical protein